MRSALPPVLIGGPALTFGDVAAVARGDARVRITEMAVSRMARAHAHVARAAAPGATAVYGVNTGFGALARTFIPVEARAELQHALVRSHAAGMGPPVPREVVRAMMLLRARTLCAGLSGTRPVVAQGLVDLLDHGITPYVPRLGSLGASGDLAPLAHAALCLLGEGWVLDADGHSRREAGPVLRAAGIEPLRLEAKEGLALLNGTDGMLGILVLACLDLRRLLRTADLVCGMSVEALLGTDRPFAAELHWIRPHPGQAASAANLAAILASSPLVRSHRDSGHAVQDAYSLRCHPQVAGAARDTLAYAEVVAERELAAVVDNPVVLDDGRIESTGNFHGEPLAFAADFLAIAASEAGAIAERRIDRLLDPARSAGLPAFLAEDPGVNSGLMIAQYTAAAIVAENRRLAAPACVDSLPTSGMQEDHVSMGWAAACKLRDVLDNLGRLLAIEALCAAWGLRLRAPLAAGTVTAAVARRVIDEAGGPGPDRFLAPRLEAVEELVRSGTLLEVAAAQGLELR